MNPVYLFTFDTDWCPSWMVDEVLDLLENRGHHATIFSTGGLALDTKERIAQGEAFELGIHPNFFTEGAVQHPESIIDPLLKELGPCTACRTHGLFWWHGLGTLLRDRGICCDSSLAFPSHSLSVPLHAGGIDRYPISWGDWSYLAASEPFEDVIDSIDSFGKIRVFNFHPVHIAMNTMTLEHWAEYRHLIRTNPDKLREIFDSGEILERKGIRQLFLQILERVAPAKSVTMSMAVERL